MRSTPFFSGFFRQAGGISPNRVLKPGITKLPSSFSDPRSPMIADRSSLNEDGTGCLLQGGTFALLDPALSVD